MKLTTKEVLALQIELQGYQLQGKVILNGLLTQKLKQSVKIKLNRLAEEVNKEIELYNKAQKEIYEQYGEKVVENEVEQLKLKEDTLEIAQKELKDLQDNEIFLDVKKILFGMTEESLDTIEDDSYYPMMYKLLSYEK